MSKQFIPWDPKFLQQSPIFSVLRDAFGTYFEEYAVWPSVDSYNQWPVVSPVKFVEQKGKATTFEVEYEPSIFLLKKVQTRSRNWHDLFNAMIWCLYPKIKQAMNQRQFNHLSKRHSKCDKRTLEENCLTHFDECGIIIASDDQTYLDWIRMHQWKAFFWNSRCLLDNCVFIDIIGHALYERAMAPYLGLTGKAVLLRVPSDFLILSLEQKRAYLDELLSRAILSGCATLPGIVLSPFPVLGWPGWHPENDHQGFYENKMYFREKR